MGNEGNAENKGGNARNGMEIQWIWVEKREVKIIENEYICKNLVSKNWSGAFLVNSGQLFHVTILKQTHKRKNNFQHGKEYNQNQHFER